MQPYTITIPIYAESEEEAKRFAQDFYQFVSEKREQGIAVTAQKFGNALAQFKDNPFLTNYLKQPIE